MIQLQCFSLLVAILGRATILDLPRSNIGVAIGVQKHPIIYIMLIGSIVGSDPTLSPTSFGLWFEYLRTLQQSPHLTP